MSIESAHPGLGGGAVIVFDGVCVLCNGWVDFHEQCLVPTPQQASRFLP